MITIDMSDEYDKDALITSLDRIRNNNTIQNVEPVVVPPVAEVTPINNPAPVSEELQSTPDMLVNTGLTKFNMPPVDENTVVEQKEPEKAVVTELPVETQSMPNKMVKKPLTFTKPTPKANKQAGFAEVIVLGVVVLVYVVIIVNLIIRLK